MTTHRYLFDEHVHALALRLGIPFMSARQIQQERLQIIYDYAEGVKHIFEQAAAELALDTAPETVL